MLSAMGMTLANIDPLLGQDPSSPLLSYAGNHAQLSVAKVSDHAFEIVLAPLPSVTAEQPEALPNSTWNYPRQMLYESRTIMDPVHGRIGEYSMSILRSPLRLIFRDLDENVIQQISWPESNEGVMEFIAETPLPGFDLNTHGNSVDQSVLAIGKEGWAILFQHPLNQGNVYYYENGKGVFIPSEDAKEAPVQLFLIFWEQREQFFDEYRSITGRASLPLIWGEELAEVD